MGNWGAHFVLRTVALYFTLVKGWPQIQREGGRITLSPSWGEVYRDCWLLAKPSSYAYVRLQAGCGGAKCPTLKQTGRSVYRNRRHMYLSTAKARLPLTFLFPSEVHVSPMSLVQAVGRAALCSDDSRLTLQYPWLSHSQD